MKICEYKDGFFVLKGVQSADIEEAVEGLTSNYTIRIRYATGDDFIFFCKDIEKAREALRRISEGMKSL